MQRNRLENLPLELLEQIIYLLSHRDVLALRLVCGQLAFAGSVAVNKSILFPITKYGKNFKPPDQPQLEKEIRLHASTVLSWPSVPVRRFTLSGLQALPKTRQIVSERVDHITDLLLHANKLEHLIIRTNVEIARPILTKLTMWPKLYKLDVPISHQTCCLNFSQIRCLTLRYKPHLHNRDREIPSLPLLTRLKIEFICPGEAWLQPLRTRLNLAGCPKLKWLKLCGDAPEQYLNILKGRTTSLKRCIIGDSFDPQKDYNLRFFGSAASRFFSRFSEGLEALIIHSGWFNTTITAAFPNLQSLKIPADLKPWIPVGSDRFVHIPHCPKLVRLSLTSREIFPDISPARNVISKLLTDLLPFYASTLQKLQLVTDPFLDCSGDCKMFQEFNKTAIGELALCENLKFLQISGYLYISEEGAQILGKGQPKLEAVMLNYLRDEVKPYSIPGLEYMRLPEGQCTAKVSTSMQVSKRSLWNGYDCPCGWTQRTRFARRMDPECMFVDDDDDDDHNIHDKGFSILENDEKTQHRIQDGLSVNRKRANQDQPEEKKTEMQWLKRQRQNIVAEAD